MDCRFGCVQVYSLLSPSHQQNAGCQCCNERDIPETCFGSRSWFEGTKTGKTVPASTKLTTRYPDSPTFNMTTHVRFSTTTICSRYSSKVAHMTRLEHTRDYLSSFPRRVAAQSVLESPKPSDVYLTPELASMKQIESKMKLQP
jgi:hypothetical protein